MSIEMSARFQTLSLARDRPSPYSKEENIDMARDRPSPYGEAQGFLPPVARGPVPRGPYLSEAGCPRFAGFPG